MNNQWEMEFDEVLKGALCRYRDRMLEEAELQEGERFPASRKFYRKIAALSGVSTVMEERRKRYEKRQVLWRRLAKTAAAAMLIGFMTVGTEAFRTPMPVTVEASLGDFVLEIHPDYLRICCRPMSEEELAQTEVREPDEFVLNRVPEGFVLKEEEQDPGMSAYVYRDGEGSTLVFEVSLRAEPGKKVGGGIQARNEHAGLHMTAEDGVELVWVEAAPPNKGFELMWTQNNCEVKLRLSTYRTDIEALELYRAVGLKEEKNEKK